jgi:hypothetical protein
MTPYFTRLRYAFRTFFSILDRDRVPEDVLAALATQVPPGAAPASTQHPEAVADEGGAQAAQMLALLQRDGRLVDFLMEDITGYADAQVGAAVRDVHAGCRQALQRYVTLAPVLPQEEGGTVEVDGPIDPAKIKVVGNPGGASLRGVLRHRGWVASHVDLPQMPRGGQFVIAPAEIDVP